MNLLVNLTDWLSKFQDNLGNYGPIGAVGGGFFDSLIQVNEITPVQYFQLIVGIYMIEVVAILSYFLSVIESGDDKIMRKHNLGKMLLIATLVYVFTVVLVYSLLSSLVPDFSGLT